MNIDLGSLFFNASIETGGGTPSWGTALGQSSPDYKLTYPGAADILVAMDYCYYPLSNDVSCKLGKGGKEYKAIDSQQGDSKYEITKAALFSNVQIKIENSLISIDKPFVLLVTKENENTHKGRRTLKYSDSARIGEFCNRDFFDAVQEALGGPKVCWYAYAIDAVEQNKLVLSLVKVSDSEKNYPDAESRKKEWSGLLPADVLDQYQQSEISTHPVLSENDTEKLFVKWMAKKLKPDGSHYSEQYQSQTKNYLKYQIGVLVPSSNAANLFRFHSFDDFEAIRKSVLRNTKFQTIDGAKHNQLSSALSLYSEFLKNIQNFITENQTKEISNFQYSQTIFYGVPGCGKSNKIREQLKNVPEKNKIRVVFHPEYTNAEFIGQILPVTNGGGIRYEFTPGPFTQIIKRAYLNPNEPFYLVIEEINRGNAAAIFGDTFQLLDRLKAGETDSLGNDPANAAVNTFTEGWSQYFVQNDDINAYIRKATKQDDGSYQERNDGEPIEEIKIKDIQFNANTAIRLPPNLSIWATMNTSDQNVFTLDNAFQRRFDMELVRNEFDLTKPAVNAQYNAEIDDTGIKWGQFWGWINAKITATLKGLSSTEDKRLGVWFVSNVGGIIDDKVFAEKVLKFLWDDVFKFKRPQVFADGIDTLEKLINFFENPPEGSARFDVFKDKIEP